MEVRCERCAAGYQFDESRVPPSGLQVKCSSCGHVFRVHAPMAATPASAAQTPPQWMVRRASGDNFQFRELTTLQRWIVERKVSRNDQISQNGQAWKRLGDIAELEAFFQAVDGAAKTQMLPTPAPAPQPLQAPTPIAAWERSPQPMPQAPVSGNWQMGAPQPAMSAPVASIHVHQASAGVSAVDDDDDDFAVRRGGKGKWIFLIVLLVVGAGVAVFFVKPNLIDIVKQRFGGVEELAVNHVNVGMTALLRDTGPSLEEAIGNFDKAISIDIQYADAHAARARALLAKADHQLELAADLAAAAPSAADADKLALGEKLGAVRQAGDALAERAFDAAKQALQLAPTDVAANLAMADYYRVKGSPSQMKPLVERVRTSDPSSAYLAYILGASLAGDATTAERAARYFDDAIDQQGDMMRARYALARTYVRLGEKDKARIQLETLLAMVPEHEPAQALLKSLAPPVAPQPEPAAAAAPKAGPLTFDQLLAQADRLRQSDQAQRAADLYNRAVEMDPESPDAYTGLGWCGYDLEEYNEAVRSFKRALSLAPRFSDAHFGLAESYRALGTGDEAIKHYRAYLDILPSGPDAAVARRMIEQMGGAR
ncbi:MAG: tetratricopeptide repeat protein [Myxococcota bacterium]